MSNFNNDEAIIFADDFRDGEVEEAILAIATHLNLTIRRGMVDKSTCGQTQIYVEADA